MPQALYVVVSIPHGHRERPVSEYFCDSVNVNPRLGHPTSCSVTVHWQGGWDSEVFEITTSRSRKTCRKPVWNLTGIILELYWHYFETIGEFHQAQYDFIRWNELPFLEWPNSMTPCRDFLSARLNGLFGSVPDIWFEILSVLITRQPIYFLCLLPISFEKPASQHSAMLRHYRDICRDTKSHLAKSPWNQYLFVNLTISACRKIHLQCPRHRGSVCPT